jgi:RNA polymerase sigma factor for flagellar operon FliA
MVITESRVSQLRAEALTLLRDGMNSQLDPELVDDAGRPEGCVARRKTAYYDQVATRGDLRSRLSMTSHFGLPVALSA